MSDKYPWQAIARQRKANKPVKVKTPTRIKQRSKKLNTELAIYGVLRRDFLLDNPVCQCGRAGCSKRATEVHHKKGRGKWLNFVEFFLAVCHECHVWIELHPVQAIAKGFSLNRLT